MVKACLGILEFPFTKDHLKNRLKTLKSNFGEVKDLFNASGWGWDEDTSMFENEDEVWKESTQDKQEASKWKATPFYHFDSLYKLFAKDRAIGELSGMTKEKKFKLKSIGIETSTT
ncbi:uncharacterized protein LOC130814593 [Amaranthus tricolor]|uniref:uncharacterized protein LOC130814593 n=1 Tax=Amaranthus tricolor TaxID=29722 RepID=UPI00258D27C7|nr:uncharacterized protein LOC130814593 [Amaranthus tricolor]XP_057536695.1 uncharacterized protein LOC130814593 [Amaranthus tricolor]